MTFQQSLMSCSSFFVHCLNYLASKESVRMPSARCFVRRDLSAPVTAFAVFFPSSAGQAQLHSLDDTTRVAPHRRAGIGSRPPTSLPSAWDARAADWLVGCSTRSSTARAAQEPPAEGQGTGASACTSRTSSSASEWSAAPKKPPRLIAMVGEWGLGRRGGGPSNGWTIPISGREEKEGAWQRGQTSRHTNHTLKNGGAKASGATGRAEDGQANCSKFNHPAASPIPNHQIFLR